MKFNCGSAWIARRLAPLGAMLLVNGMVVPQAVAQTSGDPLRDELVRITRDAKGTRQAAMAAEKLKNLPPPVSGGLGRSVAEASEPIDGRRIVNGLPTSDFSEIGALVKSRGGEPWKLACSATLVGCNQVLTAAHCFCPDGEKSNECRAQIASERYSMFFQDAGMFKVTAVRWLETRYRFPKADLALLTLDRPVEGINPAAISTRTGIATNTMGMISGYGTSGGIRQDQGIKRDGSIITDACKGDTADNTLFCWRYNVDIAPSRRPSTSNTCVGDSGGGVFVNERSGVRVARRLAGVVSGGGAQSQCVNSDVALNTDLTKYAKELAGWGIAPPSSDACLADDLQRFDRRIGGAGGAPVRIDQATPVRFYRIPVPANATALRVTMNAARIVENGATAKPAAIDFYVHKGRYLDDAGQVISTALPVCREDGGSQFAACEIKTEGAGFYTLEVRRKGANDEADVQLNATLLTKMKAQ